MNMRFVQMEEKGIKKGRVNNNEYEICVDGERVIRKGGGG